MKNHSPGYPAEKSLPVRISRILGTKLAVLIGGAAITASAWADLHPNPNADQDEQAVLSRADVVKLPTSLKNRLGRMARRPHTYLPMPAFAEADKSSKLFQYYLLDSDDFQPNIFTAIIPGINDHAIPTAANAANGKQPTIGAVRVVLEPKPGLPTDPEDVEAFIDIFTDLSGLFRHQ
jgi:hypothetical protein